MKPLLAALSLTLVACAHAPMRAELEPMSFKAAQSPAPAILVDNHFSRDRTGSLSEAQLKEILAAPVFLEEGARLGVVPVQGGYVPDGEIPRIAVPAALSDALDSSGLFDLSSEVSTDWPVDSGLAGLRELGGRYRAEYLLLYRHRFVDDSRVNGWAAGYLTLIGALFMPGQTLETAGVLEATLFDVKTGTLLFTVNERVTSETISAPPRTDRNLSVMHAKLLAEAAPRLAAQVVLKCRRLAATRPVAEKKEVLTSS